MALPALESTDAALINAEGSLGSTIGRIAATIAADHFPTGERAGLKRMARDEPPGLAFFRFWPRYLNAEAPPDARVREWAAILAGIALMGCNAHRPGRRFGAVLAETRYSEDRLERLLGTDDPEVRRTLFLRAVRFLAAKGEAFDWVGAASWLLTSDDRREDAARRIARDFYATQSRLNNNVKE
jgi:CRISPR system Cascade subunit CasB